MQEHIIKRHENTELGSLISIYFDPKGPRKLYSNIVDRDLRIGKTLGQCCSCVVQFVQGHIPEKHKRKRGCWLIVMITGIHACSVEKCLTGFVGAPHKASFFLWTA